MCGGGDLISHVRFYVLAIAVGLVFSAVAATAATTISSNISTDGNLSVTGTSAHTGLATFGNASTSLFSAYGPAYFGATATSSFSAAGILSLVSALTVPNGGTGVATFGQGWIYSNGGTGALSASTSPTVNYITATSTTATSTFHGDIVPIGRLMVPMGEVSYFNTTGTAVDITGTSDGTTNMATATPATTFNSAVAMDFDNGGSNNGTLRYTGTVTKAFHIALTFSVTPTNNNDSFVVGIAKNGTTVAASKVIQKMTTTADTQSTAMHVAVTLSTNDILTLQFGNLTGANDVTLKTMNFFAMGM